MTTGTAIIQRALEQIGAHSIVAPASPDSIVLGKEKLNSMLEMWLSRNIELGFVPLNVAGDELNEPADTTNGIIDNLSLRLAPSFDNGKTIVSRDLKAQASSGFSEIKRMYQRLNIPDKVISSTAPTGAGNQRGFRQRPFFPKGSTING